MEVILERVYLPTETLGSLYVDGKLVAKTMELPWKYNHSNISCIPEGTHTFVKMPPGFGRDYGYFRAKSIPGRNINRQLGMSTIIMHRITFVKDLKGCIGIGGEFQDLNHDSVPDMVKSSETLQKLYEMLPNEFDLIIRKKP